jgi:dynein heavy chain
MSIGEMLKKATKPPGTQRAFMLNDAQLSNENFFVYVNDILNSGYVPNLWPKEELDSHIMTLKNEAKIAGFTDKPEDLFTYFVDKIKKNCSVILCMSPVGENLRVKARKFPGLVNSSSIDYFHSWPEDALYNVSSKFLKDIDLPDEDLRDQICKNMAETHMSISEANRKFRVQCRRFKYTTPKSFLELIEFYKNLLGKK